MIRVHIQKNHLDRAGHETLIGGRVLKACKDAGIPMQGVFALRGVERGKLVYEDIDGLDGAEHVITWREDENDRENTFKRVSAKDGVKVYKSGQHYADDDDL